MACTTITLKGLNAICKEGQGGVKKAWLVPFEDILDTDITIDPDTQLITIDTAAVAKFKCFAFRRGAASFTLTGNVNENAANSVSSELTMDFLKMDPVKRLEMQALIAGGTRIVVEDSNGVMHLMGLTYPCEMSNFTGETGTAQTDPNHYSISLSDTDEYISYMLDEDTKTAIRAILPPTA